jgi:hypothetical protein
MPEQELGMTDRELDERLRSEPVPANPPEYWERFPGRVSAKILWRAAARSRAEVPLAKGSFTLARALGLGVAFLGCVLLIFYWRSPGKTPDRHSVAAMQTCLREVQLLFPNQVRAVVFEGHGAQLELSESADVPASPPIYLKIYGAGVQKEMITFSGQRVRVNGQAAEVLVDHAGNVLLVGERALWTSTEPQNRFASYRVEATPLAARL